MKKSILTFLAAAALSTGASMAQTSYTVDRVQTLLTAGDAASAVRYAISWTRAAPNNDGAWGALGMAYEQGVHQPEKAVPAFKYALAINPYSAQNYNALGEAYLVQSQFRPAAEAFEKAADLAPMKCSYWINLAAAHAALGEPELALNALKKSEVVAVPRGSWIDWYNLGAAYDKLKAYEKAVSAYQRALDMNPRGATVWTSLAAAEQALGRSAAAKEHFEFAMALGDGAGAQKHARLQVGPAEPHRSLTAMTKNPG